MSVKKEVLTCRRILSAIVLSVFIIQYMLRANISIAIVEMTQNDSTTSHINLNEEQKNEILGTFFWGYLLGAVPGGRLSEMYGPKVILGTCIFIGSILTVLTPLACQMHYYGAIAIRTTLGLFLGVLFPTLPQIVARWVPTSDRGMFMSHSAASSMGAGLAMLICGPLIEQAGWPSVFYLTGSVGIVWCIIWFYFVYDTPREHPRISEEEREELEQEIKFESCKAKEKTPWIKILTSRPVWAIIIANLGVVLNLFFILSELPSYMQQVLHYNIEENGILSSLPFIVSYVVSVVSSYLGDRWHKKKTFSTLTIRKIFSSGTLFGASLMFLIQSFWGYNRIISLLVFLTSLSFVNCFPVGYFSNCNDIAPKYSGTIFGLANTGGSLIGYLSTKMVAVFNKNSHSFGQWKYSFWTLSGVSFCTGLFYLVFASGELQEWNNSNNEKFRRLFKTEKEVTVDEKKNLSLSDTNLT